jgi:hypothetical protein
MTIRPPDNKKAMDQPHGLQTKKAMGFCTHGFCFLRAKRSWVQAGKIVKVKE